jgi:hypothetical protein
VLLESKKAVSSGSCVDRSEGASDANRKERELCVRAANISGAAQTVEIAYMIERGVAELGGVELEHVGRRSP